MNFNERNNSRKVDPELEKLRNEVETPPDLDTTVANIQRESSRVHAAYLFEHIGKATPQRLCLLLSSTATGKIYYDGCTHGLLTIEQIRCIDYDFKGLQDPTYYVLLIYVQSPEATMDKILSALQKMQQLDIINQIKDHVDDLVNVASQHVISHDGSEIIQPGHMPRASPLVLSPILTAECKTGMQESKSMYTPQDNQQKKHEQTYSCIVMLTFAHDGLPTAECITKIFRSKQPRIGVLMLQEQEKHVDYAIQILTRGYIERINPVKMHEQMHNKLDTKYLKYIYSLLRYEYVRNQCCNNRVRICMTSLHPTLQAWFRESDIDDFVNNILFPALLSSTGIISPLTVANSNLVELNKNASELSKSCLEARSNTTFPDSPWTH
ncbi:Uncharacterized protein DBV15_09702 [Temnothorax longispinosus]|uniref:Death domain-containing protein n=1 Tax=Temnothorax longispinosus TaxID=300112 RepID=A0A4V3SCT9_9HYME|nr:Uncharacterized protein DBV15_09702 [Temnothorax longispinosus]